MDLHELSERERRDWLRLIRSEQIGPVTFHQLIKRFGSAGDALERIPDIANTRKSLKLCSPDQVEAELEAADRLGVHLIASSEPSYPRALRAISDAPPVLCVAGDPGLFQRNAIAIVGARNASAVGRRMASDLARDLGTAGLVVVSGLARGIDGAAHAASLSSGTIAAVAGGIDVIYPPEHRDLTEEIARRGAVVSERPIGFKPTGKDFPRRNRIISGLSLGVIVVEAAVKSGTLITARYAAEQGRDVFSVPGSPLDPRCQGTNRLIRDGAMLIENAQDVIDSLQGATNVLREPAGDLFDHADAMAIDADAVANARREIVSLLSYTPVHRDIILREATAAPAIVADALLDLVLSGEAEEHTGGRFSLSCDAN
ncbi:DNA-protecting protein DprA [Parvularcula flava]|uniref:DNA processing protein DprA n=1 Tax=Aquisalinus luteolus TaxID=1566827 RepID=A0A8J3A2K0_9PROT|nr:DNA-processing protein DprA [Aquisalinus luteolus]NHK27370.1 DNA-protecting protein DprA [Aquisalinus luteolus]GGH95231.1 DNA processing protein DprA [Aquisalinus luteolus]